MIETLAFAYGVARSRLRKYSMTQMEQVLNCKSREAARLLLGVSRKEKNRWQKPSAKRNTSQSKTTDRKLRLIA